MINQDKKLELLRNRIQTDLKVEPENLDDLVNFVSELLKKGTKDRLLSELKEIYEDSADVETFVEWVWGVFGQEQKSTETPKKDPETHQQKEIEKKQPNKTIGFASIAQKALNDVKSRDKEDSIQTNNENKNQKYNDRSAAPRFKMNPNHGNKNINQDNDEDRMRSGGRDSKPIIKLKGDIEEERKTGSILDRVVKAGDKGILDRVVKAGAQGKRPLPTAREEEKVENKYEKIEKKIKPDLVSNTDNSTKPKRTIKTAAQVRAEEEAKAALSTQPKRIKTAAQVRAEEEAKSKLENKYEKIEKKIKPDPVPVSVSVSTTDNSTTRPKRTIKTAAQVKAEEAAKASAQVQQSMETIEEKGPTTEMQKSFTHDAPAKLKIRCRNWPHCKNEECLYHHPTENCKFFPSCPYGDKCLYIHPAIPCKFKEFCQRPGCSFVHPRPTGAGGSNFYGFAGQNPMKKKPFGGPSYKFAPKGGQGGQDAYNEIEG